MAGLYAYMIYAALTFNWTTVYYIVCVTTLNEICVGKSAFL